MTTAIYLSVLHYKDYEVTARCLDSLLQLSAPRGVSVHIVVVDNCSPNDSLGQLQKHYKSEKSISWVCSSENLGFAKGNNLGYSFVKKQGDADIVLFLNNDTEIVQPDFVECLCREYERDPFDVLSIDVYDPYADQHQSPLCNGSEIAEYARRTAQGSIALSELPFFKRAVFSLKEAVAQIAYPLPAFQRWLERRVKATSRSANWDHSQSDVVPQGACVIFGRRYIDRMDYAFYPKTHMYFEECILKVLCDQNGFGSRYTPKLQILHHHHEITDRSSLRRYSVLGMKHAAELTLEGYQEFLTLYGNTDPISLDVNGRGRGANV